VSDTDHVGLLRAAAQAAARAVNRRAAASAAVPDPVRQALAAAWALDITLHPEGSRIVAQPPDGVNVPATLHSALAEGALYRHFGFAADDAAEIRFLHRLGITAKVTSKAEDVPAILAKLDGGRIGIDIETTAGELPALLRWNKDGAPVKPPKPKKSEPPPAAVDPNRARSDDAAVRRPQ
jgi:hypothetical protein